MFYNKSIRSISHFTKSEGTCTSTTRLNSKGDEQSTEEDDVIPNVILNKYRNYIITWIYISLDAAAAPISNA